MINKQIFNYLAGRSQCVETGLTQVRDLLICQSRIQTAIFSQSILRLMLWGLLMGGLSLAGCQMELAETQHAVYFHKPQDYPQAIKRLQEIHFKLNGSAQLPPPRLFLIPQTDANDESHHDHVQFIEINQLDESTFEGKLTEIDIRRELQDIAAWLPSIAADSNLPKSDWDQINQHAKQLNQKLSEVNRGGSDQFLARYQNLAAEIESILARLAEFIDRYYVSQEKFPI